MRALGTTAALIGSLLVTGVFARPVMAATGDISEFTLPATTTPPTSGPQNIAIGADGNIWFTIQNSDQIGYITPGAPNSITVFNVPTANSQPNGIALGPDGNIWFTEFNAGKIGEITPGGTISEYTLPAGSASGPRNIAPGPDGTMWFTEYNANKIGEIIVADAVNGTSDGVSEYTLAASTNPRGIIEGPDGNIWFTEFTADMVGYLNPSSPTTAPTLFTVPTSGRTGISGLPRTTPPRSARSWPRHRTRSPSTRQQRPPAFRRG
jgi:streptogramin lyase